MTSEPPYKSLSNHKAYTHIAIKKQHPDPIGDTSQRGRMFWLFLLRCWDFDPKKRAVAAQVKTMVRRFVDRSGARLYRLTRAM